MILFIYYDTGFYTSMSNYPLIFGPNIHFAALHNYILKGQYNIINKGNKFQ